MQKFFTGDRVKYINKDGYWKLNENHIIHECDYQGNGQFQYSTNHGAWFEDTDFILIRKATEKSFAQLDRNLEDD